MSKRSRSAERLPDARPSDLAPFSAGERAPAAGSADRKGEPSEQAIMWFCVAVAIALGALIGLALVQFTGVA